MLIEWTLTRAGECKRLEDVPPGASVVAIDDEPVIDKCEGCGTPILESAPHHAWADGIITCVACGGPEETARPIVAPVAEEKAEPFVEEDAATDPTAAYKAALLALTRPQIKGDRCRWCRNRRTRVHSSGCPTTIATAALRGIAPRERTPE